MNRFQGTRGILTGRPAPSSLAMVLLMAGGLTVPAGAAGVQWRDLTIQQAIEEAKEGAAAA